MTCNTPDLHENVRKGVKVLESDDCAKTLCAGSVLPCVISTFGRSKAKVQGHMSLISFVQQDAKLSTVYFNIPICIGHISPGIGFAYVKALVILNSPGI